MKNKKISLDKLLLKMTKEQSLVCKNIINDYKVNFNSIPGSSNNHQNWKGGYKDHVEEVMNIAVILYKSLSSKRKLNFDLSEALFTLFLHDLDKIFRYKIINNAIKQKSKYTKDFVDKILKLVNIEYNYKFSYEEINALKYVHGEGSDYSSKKRVIMPLGAFIHCCDIISARIWFDKGNGDFNW